MPIEGRFQKNLEGVHIYALADLLKRTIIVYGKPNPDALPDIVGIYLPNIRGPFRKFDTVMDNPANPIMLAYENGHFLALLLNSRCADKAADQISMDGHNGKCMPIHFPYGQYDRYYRCLPEDPNLEINNDEEMPVNEISGKRSLNRKLRMLAEYVSVEHRFGVSFITINLDGM